MEEKKMISLLTLTNSFVYRILKKKEKQEIKVVPSEMSIHDFLRGQLEKVTSTPRSIIELKERILNAIGEGQKSGENGESENEGTSGTTQKTDLEIFKEFLTENFRKDGKMPEVEVIKEKLGLSKNRQAKLKNDLVDIGFLYKENARVFKMNQKLIRT